MSTTFRTTKLTKFIQKNVEFLERQQKVINEMHQNRVEPGVVIPLKYNQNATYNLVVDLCNEFNLEIPYIDGLTKK